MISSSRPGPSGIDLHPGLLSLVACGSTSCRCVHVSGFGSKFCHQIAAGPRKNAATLLTCAIAAENTSSLVWSLPLTKLESGFLSSDQLLALYDVLTALMNACTSAFSPLNSGRDRVRLGTLSIAIPATA